MTKHVPLLRELPRAQRDLVAALLRAKALQEKRDAKKPGGPRAA